MQYYAVIHGKDGYSLHVGNKKRWSLVVARAAEKIDLLTGDRWCAGLHSDWFWEHSFGPRKFDKYGLSNSINDKIINSFNWVLNLEWRGEKEHYQAPITKELARILDPEFVDMVNV